MNFSIFNEFFKFLQILPFLTNFFDFDDFFCFFNFARLLIVDLKAERLDPMQAIDFLKTAEALKGVPVIAFVAHVQTETIRRAQAAGCDMVLPHSAFTQMLPDIVTGNLDKLKRFQP